MIYRILIIVAILIVTVSSASAQSTSGSNVVTTAVPFLTIAPDSRAGAIGDAGVATKPDINSQHWNAAKYSFIDSKSGIALSYTPWLRSLVPDMNLAYLVGYTKLDERQTVSGSLKFFDLGSITYYNDSGDPLETQSPNEFSVDMGYALKLTNNLSASVTLRYLRSDLFSGAMVDNIEMKPGNSYGADVGFYYQKNLRINRKNNVMSFGANVSNIGSKLSYDNGETKDFIPTNLRIGGAYEMEIDKYNKMMFTADINKLLVPTRDTIGSGNEPRGLGNQDIGPIEGIFKSFSDAPGGGQEELQEIMYSLGAEYIYSEQFAVRAGYFHEHENKGARKFLTFGAGLKMNVFTLDFSYIYTLSRTSPLENTLRFTIGFDLDDFQNQSNKRRRR